ncbi:MAG TPA: hypothetical protein VMW10_08995 [Alphaproteobacteria bacterium]|nr:hypothetical protein [Alphaproteobacteria bacterium]
MSDLKKPSNCVGKPDANPVGRPRTVSLPPDEMVLLGKEMVAWCEENKPIHLSKWWSIHKDISDDDWECLKRAPEFLRYYTKAMRIVGFNYIDKDSSVDNRIKDRWLRVYFKDLRAQEDEDARFTSALKQKEQAVISEQDAKKLDSFVQAINEAQEASISRKIDDSKSKEEQ